MVARRHRHHRSRTVISGDAAIPSVPTSITLAGSVASRRTGCAGSVASCILPGMPVDLPSFVSSDPPGPSSTGFAAADIDCPFPVAPEYAVRADLQKLGDAPLLVEDGDWSHWMRQKRERLAHAGALQRAPSLDDARLADLALRVAAAFQSAVPDGPVDGAGGLPWAGLPPGLPPEDFLLGLTLSLQEDLVLMVRDERDELTAQWLAVCFPSGWRPAEKLGQSMSRIHAPVADNARLQQATSGLEQAITSKGPFLRHVWTLAGSGSLHKDPGTDAFEGVRSIDDLWFRCERQVTVPLCGNACLFLIRVFVAPLREVAGSPERFECLRRALASMSPAVVEYKGLGRVMAMLGVGRGECF